VGFCGIFEHFSGFEFFLLPNIVHARPHAGNANRSAAKGYQILMSINFLTLFQHYKWSSGILLIRTALERWAILVVDPSGEAVPEKWLHKKDYFELVEMKGVEYQSPEQNEEWYKLISNFHNRITKRAEDYESTFAAGNIERIREYLTDIPAYETVVKDSKIPNDKIVARIKKVYYVNEQVNGLCLSDYMLHLDREGALSFLENISIYWASNLLIDKDCVAEFERGRYLNLLAEQIESD